MGGETYINTKEDDNETGDITMMTGIQVFELEEIGIAYNQGWVYRKQVIWPTPHRKLEYRVKRGSLSSLRLAKSKMVLNDIVFNAKLHVQIHHIAVVGWTKYSSRDTEIARQIFNIYWRYKDIGELWRMETGRQPNCTSQEEVGSFFILFLVFIFIGNNSIR